MPDQTVTVKAYHPYPAFYWEFSQGGGQAADITGYDAYNNADNSAPDKGQFTNAVAINATVADVGQIRCTIGSTSAGTPTPGAEGTTTTDWISVSVGALEWEVNPAPITKTIQAVATENHDDMVLAVTAAAGGLSVIIPFRSGNYDCTVDWGDETTPDTINVTGGVPDVSHTYAAEGTYDITVSGTADSPDFDNSSEGDKLVDIKRWGRTGWTTLNDAFYGTELTTVSAGPESDTSGVNNMLNAFNGCSTLVTLDVTGWDTSSVTTMWGAFNGCGRLASIDLTSWNTANVTAMRNMFNSCNDLTALEVSDLDIGKVNTMRGTFNGCGKLATLDVSSWDTGSLADAQNMFLGCSSLTELDISNFDISSLTNGTGLLDGSGYCLNSSDNYKLTIVNWNNQAGKNNGVNVHFGAHASLLGDATAEAARANLVSSHGWTITDSDGTWSPAARSGGVTQVTSDVPIYWSAIGPSGDIVHTGHMEGGLTVSTGQASIIYSNDMNQYLEDLNGSSVIAPPLPATGAPLEANEVYSWDGENVIVRQAHTRTADDPNTVPALFSVWRADYGGLHWVANEDALAGCIRRFGDTDYKCIQRHTTQEGWTPPATPALWTEVVSGIQPWEQPTGAHDAYQAGDKVTHVGSTWESDVNNNVWEPGVYGWSIVSTP